MKELQNIKMNNSRGNVSRLKKKKREDSYLEAK
jgi:hypothetical protein